jgi:hypothetical protein
LAKIKKNYENSNYHLSPFASCFLQYTFSSLYLDCP